MTTITTLYNKVKAMNTDKIAVESVAETSQERETLNIEQINQGKRSDGTEILPSYTETTILIKKLKGQPYDRVTLEDEGNFYRGIKSNVEGNLIITESSDIKNAKLKKKYETSKGKLFGLGGDFKIEYIDKSLRPTFHKKIELATGLKISK